MPTPFTHLHYAQRALVDPAVDAPLRALLEHDAGAYLLGSVVADGHFLASLKREDTHFYTYDRPIEPPPWEIMLARYPALARPTESAQRAFVAAYVFHLAMDAYWSKEFTAPQFGLAEWATREQRFVMLHILLIHMDTRDLAALDPARNAQLAACAPGDWLPFLPQQALIGWRDLIHRQIMTGGVSETFDIFAPRVGMTPEQLRLVNADEAMIARKLWAHVSRAVLADREAGMYGFARAQLVAFLGG